MSSFLQAGAENDGPNSKRSKADEGNQKQGKEDSKLPEPPKDYIHVRARRGQATDSHSLAERVRITIGFIISRSYYLLVVAMNCESVISSLITEFPDRFEEKKLVKG